MLSKVSNNIGIRTQKRNAFGNSSSNALKEGLEVSKYYLEQKKPEQSIGILLETWCNVKGNQEKTELFNRFLKIIDNGKLDKDVFNTMIKKKKLIEPFSELIKFEKK